MSSASPSEKAVCGACVSFEASRDPKYGYCKLALRLDRERSLSAGARLVDLDHECFMAHSLAGMPAFSRRAA